MNKLTPKQRRKIYLKVYNSLENGSWKTESQTFPFLCDLIGDKLNIPSLYNPEKYGFTEFLLFKPRKYKLGWWKNKDIDSRKNALLFCIELTKDAKE